MSAKKTTETTLTQLTKRFVKLLNTSSERVINLNEASTKLSVAKRRIYDITNVLEGIGLLQKTSKNVTRWIDCPPDSPLAASYNATATTNTANTTTTTPTTNISTNTSSTNNNQLEHQQQQQSQNSVNNVKIESATHQQQQQQSFHHSTQNGLPDAELVSLLKTYKALDESVNELMDQIRNQLQADGAYVTYQDIKSFFEDQIVIAVKAPPETRLEVNESLQIWMKSEGEGIEVYLCPQFNNDNTSNNFNNNTTETTTTLAQPPPPPPTQPIQQQTQIQIQQTQHQPQSQNYGVHYDTTTSGISTDDHYYTNNDPTLSSALSSGEEEDLYTNIPIVPAEGPNYSFMLDDNYTLNSLFPDNDLGIF